MKEHARVVVIGGGVAGASTLYHLAMRGWTDAVLIEMDELTSGSTWHAAGNIPTFSGDRNVMRLQHYSTELYTRLAADPAYPIAYHKTGSIRLAQTRERMQEFRHVAAMANAMDFGYEMLTLEEMKRRNPFLEDHDLLGALWDPNDGDIDPSQLTQALSSAARAAGATVRRFTRVTGLERADAGEWDVVTDKGTVRCEYVVNAGGYRGAEVTALGGRFLPLVSMEHQYLVTEPVPELAGLAEKMALVRDPDDSYYLRQEKEGLILGPYEWKATPHAPWADGTLPEDFASQLYPDDLERLEWYIEKACERMPILGTVGVQRVINGPIPYAPDGLPYVGPAYGLPNVFHCCGFSFGICQGGGAGKSIAEWIIDGKPEWDLWSLDPRRYGDYADQSYVVDRATEVYQHEYAIHFPVQEWPAGRPRLVSPLYETYRRKGACFGARGGWERATWFPRLSDPGESGASYARGAWFEAVGEECLAVRDAAGLLDICGFTRLRLEGAGAAAWLDSLIAGRVPTIGRVGLSYLCAPSGGVWSELTITRLGEERFVLVGGAPARRHDRQWLEEHRPAEATFTLEDVSEAIGTLVVVGPASREILSALTETELSNEAFRWLACAEITVAGIELLAQRVNYVGELGWELHAPVGDLLALYEALHAAGAGHGLRDVGMYAMDSLRLEKSYRGWKTELDHTLSPFASGLGRFVALDKAADFIGKAALVAETEAGGPAERFVTLELDALDTDAFFGCPLRHDGEVVGMTTSGGYGHRIGKSIALGYVRPSLAIPGTTFEVELVGTRVAARVVEESPFDPDNTRLRA